MSLNVLKTEIISLCNKKGWLGPNIEQIWMYFTEEVGELAGAIRRQRNQFRDRKHVKIESEMGDVFSYLFQLAYMLNIDLDKMWLNQKAKILNKRYYIVNANANNEHPIRSVYCKHEESESMQKSWKVRN